MEKLVNSTVFPDQTLEYFYLLETVVGMVNSAAGPEDPIAFVEKRHIDPENDIGKVAIVLGYRIAPNSRTQMSWSGFTQIIEQTREYLLSRPSDDPDALSPDS